MLLIETMQRTSKNHLHLRTAQEGSLFGKKMKVQNYFLRLQPTNIEKTMMLNLGDVSYITQHPYNIKNP